MLFVRGLLSGGLCPGFFCPRPGESYYSEVRRIYRSRKSSQIWQLLTKIRLNLSDHSLENDITNIYQENRVKCKVIKIVFNFLFSHITGTCNNNVRTFYFDEINQISTSSTQLSPIEIPPTSLLHSSVAFIQQSLELWKWGLYVLANWI